MARKNSDAAARAASGGGLNPRWWVPTALGLMLLGLVWVMTYYISSGAYPIPNVDAINIVVGFPYIMVVLNIMSRWM